MVVAIWLFGDTGQRRFLYLSAILGGTALAIKFGGLAFVVAALPVAAIEVRRQWRRMGPRPALSTMVAFALLLAAALPTYAISWRMTGDPVFPFLNQVFPSPIIDSSISFVDYRYHQPIDWRSLYDLTFHCRLYGEGRPGSLGFEFLLLAPLGWMALIFVRRRPAVSAAVFSLTAILIILKLLPNSRYMYPALPLTLIPLAAMFGLLRPGVLRRGLITLAAACIVLNVCFLSASNYYHGDFYQPAPLSRGARRSYMHEHAPMREVGQYMNQHHPGAKVLLADGADISAFNAEVYSIGWHQYPIYARVLREPTTEDLHTLLEQWDVHYLAAPRPGFGTTINPRTLRNLINWCTTPEFESNHVYVARLDSQCRYATVRRVPLLVDSGIYDDLSPAIVFNGPWIQDEGWEKTRQHTVTFCNMPGSDIRFAFRGSVFSYVYTKAANRGMADVVIDGVHQATLDLYSPTAQWQSQTIFNLKPGTHLAVITILPDKNPKATDLFVDLDGFEVR
jgi:hypothetical protein